MAAEPTTYIDVQTTDNTIPSDLRADIMRESMENKNLLSQAGSIYVGKGISENKTCTVGGTTKTARIARTGVLMKGKKGQILTVNDDIDVGKNKYGLAYEYISAGNFSSAETDLSGARIKLSGDQLADGSVVNAKMQKGAYPKIHKIRHAGTAEEGETEVDLPQGTLLLYEDGVDGYLTMGFSKRGNESYTASFSSSGSGTSLPATDKADMLGFAYACFYIVAIDQEETQYNVYSAGNVYFLSESENFAKLSFSGPITTSDSSYSQETYDISLSWGGSDSSGISITGTKWTQTTLPTITDTAGVKHGCEITYKSDKIKDGELLFVRIN